MYLSRGRDGEPTPHIPIDVRQDVDLRKLFRPNELGVPQGTHVTLMLDRGPICVYVLPAERRPTHRYRWDRRVSASHDAGLVDRHDYPGHQRAADCQSCVGAPPPGVRISPSCRSRLRQGPRYGGTAAWSPILPPQIPAARGGRGGATGPPRRAP